MNISGIYDLPIPTPIQTAYRKARASKNRLINLIDAPVVVLIYHRVIDLESDPEMIAVSPGNFRLSWNI
jgi:hypothetical protein